MKRTGLKISAAGLVAALIVGLQWAACFGGDDFTLIDHDNNRYKLFTYGFPFHIKDANPIIDMASSPSQTLLRIGANFCVFFAMGICVVFMSDKRRGQK